MANYGGSTTSYSSNIRSIDIKTNCKNCLNYKTMACRNNRCAQCATDKRSDFGCHGVDECASGMTVSRLLYCLDFKPKDWDL